MAFSHYPYGVSSFGAPMIPAPWGRPIGFGGKGNVTGTGVTVGPGSQVYFVNSALATASDAAVSNGLDPLRPFKTINFAVGRCLANNGDVIFVGPGHVETVSAAAGLTIGVAGVTIIGIGNDRERPIVNYTTSTAATVTVTAANTWIQGLRFQNSIDARVDGIIISAADCRLVDCWWDDDTNKGSVISVRTTSAGTRLKIINCNVQFPDNGGTARTEWLRIVGGDSHIIQDTNIMGIFTTANVNNITTAMTNVVVKFCVINNNSGALAFAQLVTSQVNFIGTMLATTGADAITDSTTLNMADMASGQMVSGATTSALIDFAA